MPRPQDAAKPGPSLAIQEGHLEVTRTARFAQLGRIGAETRQIWFVCHGYRQLAARFIRRFTPLVDLGCVVVAPEALSRFYIDVAPGRHGSEARIGATWMTRADRETEIRDYVRYLDRLAAKLLDQPRPGGVQVVALGFSQGGHTAVRWAALGNTELDHLVVWGSYLPGDVTLPPDRPGRSLTLVYGDEDPTRDPSLERSQEERILASGRSVMRRAHPGGHRIHDETLIQLAHGFSGASGTQGAP
ncbi:MAG: phospholipase [Gemmatimonadetes bacterium]|nr:phospholipase [Gemmatimonadota bacterium]